MELELGLAVRSTIRHVDLNSRNYDLGLQLSSPNWFSVGNTPELEENGGTSGSKKRCFAEFVEENRNRIVPETLSLLLWDNQPSDGEDNHHNHPDQGTSSLVINRNDVDGVVGWPPVRTWRTKKLRPQNYGRGCGVRTPNSKFVKVKMEGVAIARKIDLGLHHSLETVRTTLYNMFGCENPDCFELAFQDRINGDWILAEGMQWDSFVCSVQRLKLSRVGACSTNQ